MTLSVLCCAGNCNGDATCRDDFYSDPVAVGYYKDHVRRIVTRVNTFNGRAYRYSVRLHLYLFERLCGDVQLLSVQYNQLAMLIFATSKC